MDIVATTEEEARWRPTELGALAMQLEALLERLETVEARLEALDDRQERRQTQVDAMAHRVHRLDGDLRDHEWRHPR